MRFKSKKTEIHENKRLFSSWYHLQNKHWVEKQSVRPPPADDSFGIKTANRHCWLRPLLVTSQVGLRASWSRWTATSTISLRDSSSEHTTAWRTRLEWVAFIHRITADIKHTVLTMVCPKKATVQRKRPSNEVTWLSKVDIKMVIGQYQTHTHTELNIYVKVINN